MFVGSPDCLSSRFASSILQFLSANMGPGKGVKPQVCVIGQILKISDVEMSLPNSYYA
jgi:hypothetical protein